MATPLGPAASQLLKRAFEASPPRSKRHEAPPLTDVHYVLCNELNQDGVLAEVASQPSLSNEAHIGFACWYNYDLIAIRRPQKAFICDCDENMLALYNLMKKIILDADGPDAFLEAFWQDLSSNIKLDFQGLLSENEFLPTCKDLKNKVLGKGWMTNEGFAVVKQMFAEDKIHFRLLDITDSRACEQIAHEIQSSGLQAGTIYGSNILDWLDYRKKEMMLVNLKKWVTPNSSVILAEKEGKLTGKPLLRHAKGGLPPKRTLH
jgi:hypothetical protein